MDTDETLEFSRDNDLFDALTYAIACSKSAHEGLHAFEAGRPFATCARAIEGVVETVSCLLAELTEMVDLVRREGRSWTELSRDAKDRRLRQAFDRSHQGDDFVSVHTVWWEPFELYGRHIEAPADGCPAQAALWRQLDPATDVLHTYQGSIAAAEANTNAAALRQTGPGRLFRMTGTPSGPSPDVQEADRDRPIKGTTRLN